MKYLYLIFALVCAYTINAAPLKYVPNQVSQPDGEIIQCFASGDEFYNWLHDANGYTIIQNKNNGYYYYAFQSGDSLVPSNFRVNHIDPTNLGIQPWLRIAYQKLKPKYDRILNTIDPPRSKNENNLEVNNIGTINNIVIFIRFSDETEFTDSTALYDRMFNAATGNSMKHYFQEASYNQLNINSYQYPNNNNGIVVSFQDAQPRGYYKEYSATNTIGYQTDAEATQREHTLLVNAVNGVSAQIPTNIVIDNDNDNRVDNVCFIVSGSSEGWSDLLWPHRWSLYSQTVNINNKRVYDYNFQLRNSLMSSGVGVLCHEMFHSLGAPDLYHYTSNGISPVGSWDIMENDQNPPQHMGTYMKWKYGDWIASIPQISTNGIYTLNPITSSTNNCYKIQSPNSTSEYFVVEYRKDEGTFESSIPGSGLIIYRINPNYNGNASGPPDEVYAYRPNGTLTVNGTVSSANFSSNVSRTSFSASTNPSPFLSNGSQGGISIYNIGAAGTTISFSVSFTVIPPSLIYPPNNQIFVNTNTNFVWSSVFTASSYRLCIATDSLFTQNVNNYYINDTLYTASNLANNTNYYWRIKSISGTDTSDWSQIFHFSTLPAGYMTFIDEGFDNTTFPPTGWAANIILGTRNWERVTSGTNPSCNPYSGVGMASYASYYAYSGNGANLVTPAIDLSNTGLVALEFKMYRDGGYDTNTDRVEVYINNQANTENAYLLGTINRTTTLSPAVSSTGWYNNNLTIPDAYKTQGVYIIFKSISNYGNSMFIDAVKLYGVRNIVEAPSLVSPVNNAFDVPVNNTFVWSSVSSAISYRMELSNYQDFSSIVESYTSTDTLKIIQNLNNNSTYYWRVKAISANDSSVWSPVWTFVTAPQELASPVLVSPANQAANVSITPTLRWNLVSNAINYRIELTDNSSFNNIIKDEIVTGNKLVLPLVNASSQYYWRVKAFTENDSSEWSLVSSFNTMNNINLPNDWAIEQNENKANIELLTNGTFEISERLFTAGDAIGIFYDDAGIEKCGGYIVWGDAAENLTVFGDNLSTQSKDGFSDNEVYKIKIWDNINSQILKGYISYSSGSGFYVQSSNSIADSVVAVMPGTHTIALNTGWNMISSYNLPMNDSISVITQGLENDIELIKNNAGSVYWLPYMQTLKKWNHRESYMVYTNNSCNLDIVGYQIDPAENPIYFPEVGWYWIPYFNTQSMPTTDALASISGNFTLIKSIDGDVYWYPYVNSLSALEPSNGYLIHINNPDTLVYPVASNSGKWKNEEQLYAEPKHFVPNFSNTGSSAIIGLKIKDAQVGDEIGIFTENGLLIGSAVHEGEQLGILYWGDDFLTEDVEGALENEKLKIILYRESESLYSELKFVLLKDNISGDEVEEFQYKTDAILYAETELGELGVETNSLNDFSAEYSSEGNLVKVNSSFGLIFDNIRIFDYLGNCVYDGKNIESSNCIIDASFLSSGMYNIVAQGANFKLSKKLIIIK